MVSRSPMRGKQQGPCGASAGPGRPGNACVPPRIGQGLLHGVTRSLTSASTFRGFPAPAPGQAASASSQVLAGGLVFRGGARPPPGRACGFDLQTRASRLPSASHLTGEVLPRASALRQGPWSQLPSAPKGQIHHSIHSRPVYPEPGDSDASGIAGAHAPDGRRLTPRLRLPGRKWSLLG